MGRKAWMGFCFFLMVLPAVSAWGIDTADDYYRAAKQFYSQKDYAHAYDSYQGAVLLDPNPYRAYIGMGNCQYFLGDKAKALECYQKSLALHPDNPALVPFIQRVKDELANKGGPFYKGKVLLQGKKYKLAIPYFQEAQTLNPKDLTIYYDLAYCQYMTGDRAQAALNFAYYGEKKPDPQVTSVADKIKAALKPDDQRWFDDSLAAGPPFSAPFHYSGIGLRLEPTYQLTSLKDFNDYANSLNAEGNLQKQNDSTFSLTATAPGGGLGVDLNPFIQVVDGFEAGLTFGALFVGGFNASYQGQNDTVSGNGLINYQVFETGISLRGNFIKFDKDRVRIFVEANPDLYLTSLQVANSDTSGTTPGWDFLPVAGNFSGSGVGGRFKLGVEWKPIPNSLFSFFGGYQIAQIQGFHGTTTAPTTASGQLEVERYQGNTAIGFVPNGSTPTVPSGAQLNPLTLDLSGVIFGVDFIALL